MEDKCICIDKQLLSCNAKNHKCACDVYKPKIIIRGMGVPNLNYDCKACLKK
jgi:hypothetical protein